MPSLTDKLYFMIIESIHAKIEHIINHVGGPTISIFGQRNWHTEELDALKSAIVHVLRAGMATHEKHVT